MIYLNSSTFLSESGHLKFSFHWAYYYNRQKKTLVLVSVFSFCVQQSFWWYFHRKPKHNVPANYVTLSVEVFVADQANLNLSSLEFKTKTCSSNLRDYVKY
jgi:hypothetical protein